MGFLDNFKAAMQRGAEAANANIERQRAEKAAAESRMVRRAQPQGRPQARPQQGHTLPEGVVAVSLNDMQIALGTNSKGQNVIMFIHGTLLAKPMGQTTLDKEAQKAEIGRIARETLEREIIHQIESMGDLKFLMMFANRMNRVICEEIKAHGYEAAMKMPLVIRPN